MGALARGIGLAVLATILAGCDVATSRQPVGRSPAPVAELKLEGVWHSSDGRPFFVRLVDAAAGQLEVAVVNANKDGFVLERTEVLLRSENDQVLANLRGRDAEADEGYTFGRLTVADDALVLTLASPNALRPLVLDGTLGGILTTNSSDQRTNYGLVVTNGFDRLAGLLASPGAERWLKTTEPIVLMRQKAGLD